MGTPFGARCSGRCLTISLGESDAKISNQPSILVGGFNPFEKYYSSQNANLPQIRGENKNI